ncbi:unnamed protein product [Lymnaea stagnalis]|uniref:THD domain-containing protein n=1 Tax=Lymnaea stagnalis TaxID=6523 RepID=A0AAV2IBJ9_LYMST
MGAEKKLMKDKDMDDQGFDRVEAAEPQTCIVNTKTQKVLTVLTIVMSLLAIIISIVCIVLVATSPSQEDMSLNEGDGGSLACVSRDKFKYSNSPEQTELMMKLDEGVNDTYCATTPEQLGALLKLVLIRTVEPIELPPVENPHNFSMSRASMHKKLVPSNWYDIDPPERKYPIFDPNVNYSLQFTPDEVNQLLEHNRNMDMQESVTVIRESGLYMVYCSVHFKPDSAENCSTFAKKTWSANVVRTRNNDDTFSGTILSMQHTCCDDCVRNQETGYTAGVFLLRTHDKLHVEVSGEGLVSYRPQSTYFGLTMLGAVNSS